MASAAALAAAARPALPWRALERSAEDGGLRCLLQGWGVFAGQDIPGEVIYTAYIGEIVSKEEADRREHGNGYDGQVSWMAGGGGGTRLRPCAPHPLQRGCHGTSAGRVPNPAQASLGAAQQLPPTSSCTPQDLHYLWTLDCVSEAALLDAAASRRPLKAKGASTL